MKDERAYSAELYYSPYAAGSIGSENIQELHGPVVGRVWCCGEKPPSPHRNFCIYIGDDRGGTYLHDPLIIYYTCIGLMALVWA